MVRTVLRKTDLSTAGNAYVESCLQQGGGLCARVLNLGISHGKAFAALPPDADQGRAVSFKLAGIVSWKDSLNWFLDHVTKLSSAPSFGSLILQDIWAKPTDPYVEALAQHRFIGEQNVYYLFEKEHVDSYTILRAMRGLNSYLFVSFVSHSKLSEGDFLGNNILQEATIDELANGVYEVLVGAYDQDGFVGVSRETETAATVQRTRE
jgi:hypothetical protein